MKTVLDTLRRTRQIFEVAGLESPAADARLLLAHALGISQEKIILQEKEVVSESEETRLEECIARRLKREPVSRIIGGRYFWKSYFKINNETLDPRSDSEFLVETALRHAKNPARVLDLGTGTGCLLVSVLQEWPEAEGVGLDICPESISIATENATDCFLSPRSKFEVSDWKAYVPEASFDVVISNPPYIATGEAEGLAPEVALYDPPRALFAGADGLEAYREILACLPRLLSPCGYVFFEVGYRQAAAVRGLLEQSGLTVLETARDLAGHERCVAAQKKLPIS